MIDAGWKGCQACLIRDVLLRDVSRLLGSEEVSQVLEVSSSSLTALVFMLPFKEGSVIARGSVFINWTQLAQHSLLVFFGFLVRE